MSESPSQPRLALIGGGRMGRALLAGVIDSGVLAAANCAVAEPSEENLRWWEENQSDVARHRRAADAVGAADSVLLAVKPDVIPAVAAEIGDALGKRLIVSVAAGVTLARLRGLFHTERIVRVMPNTPCLVGAGASAYCGGAAATEDDLRWVESLLGAVGLAVAVEEKWMDAVTGVSGSGPAFLFLAIEALADGGVRAGLPRALALQLAAHTARGAAEMVLKTGLHPGELKDQVTSPGGTTIAGLHVLEQNAFRGALISAVQQAAQRSAELGGR